MLLLPLQKKKPCGTRPHRGRIPLPLKAPMDSMIASSMRCHKSCGSYRSGASLNLVSVGLGGRTSRRRRRVRWPSSLPGDLPPPRKTIEGIVSPHMNLQPATQVQRLPLPPESGPRAPAQHHRDRTTSPRTPRGRAPGLLFPEVGCFVSCVAWLKMIHKARR